MDCELKRPIYYIFCQTVERNTKANAFLYCAMCVWSTERAVIVWID